MTATESKAQGALEWGPKYRQRETWWKDALGKTHYFREIGQEDFEPAIIPGSQIFPPGLPNPKAGQPMDPDFKVEGSGATWQKAWDSYRS